MSGAGVVLLEDWWEESVGRMKWEGGRRVRLRGTVRGEACVSGRMAPVQDRRVVQDGRRVYVLGPKKKRLPSAGNGFARPFLK